MPAATDGDMGPEPGLLAHDHDGLAAAGHPGPADYPVPPPRDILDAASARNSSPAASRMSRGGGTG
ncbi:hypothetical protein JHV675_52910 [Mycobacterium avium subsp. hominissuis]